MTFQLASELFFNDSLSNRHLRHEDISYVMFNVHLKTSRILTIRADSGVWQWYTNALVTGTSLTDC